MPLRPSHCAAKPPPPSRRRRHAVTTSDYDYSMCQGPIKQRARAEKCLYKGTTCTPWHIKVLLLFGGGRFGCGRLSGARPGCWWLSVYGHEGRPVTAYTAVWPTAPTGPKNGRMGGVVGSGQYRGAVVRQLLENQNTKGHWCPVDG